MIGGFIIHYVLVAGGFILIYGLDLLLFLAVLGLYSFLIEQIEVKYDSVDGFPKYTKYVVNLTAVILGLLWGYLFYFKNIFNLHISIIDWLDHYLNWVNSLNLIP